VIPLLRHTDIKTFVIRIARLEETFLQHERHHLKQKNRLWK